MMAALGGMTTAHRVGAARSCVRDRAGSHVRACARPSAGFGRNARPLVLCQARPSKPQKVGSSPSPGGVAPKHLNQASAVAVRAHHPTSPDHHTIPTYPTARSRPFAVHGARAPPASTTSPASGGSLLSVLSRRRVKRSHLFANFNQPMLTASLPPIPTGPAPGALDRRGRPLRRPAQPRGGTPRRGHRRARTKAQALNQRRARGDRRKIRVVRVGQHVRSHLNRHHRHVLPAPPRGLRRRRVPVVGAVRTAGAHRGRRGGHGVLRAVRSQVPVARLPVVNVHEGS